MLSVKVSSKFQIAVPSEVRQKLGIKAGDRLDVEVEGDVIHLRRYVPAAIRLYGIGRQFYDGVDAVDRVREMRDESERSLTEMWDRIDAERT